MERKLGMRSEMSASRGRLCLVRVTAVALAFGASVAGARVVAEGYEDEAPQIVGEVLAATDVNSVEAQVRTELQQQIRLAIQIGVIEEDELSELGFVAADDAGTAATPTTLRTQDQLRQRIESRIAEQIQRWETIAPEWREAFGPLREQLRTCRVDASEGCLEEYRLEMQYRHAEQVQSTYQNRLSDSAGQGTQTQDLEQQRERAQLRVETMIQDGSANDLTDNGITLQEMERLRTQLQEQLRDGSGSTSTSVVSSSSVGDSSQGKGKP